jgi:hypothetical protein
VPVSPPRRSPLPYVHAPVGRTLGRGLWRAQFHYFGVDEIEEDSVIVQYAGILAMHGVAFASDAPYSKWQRRPDTKEAAYKVCARCACDQLSGRGES